MGLLHDCEHGDHCDCLLLARAVGAAPETIDFNYCRQVLQKHWGMRCNHGMHGCATKRSYALPPHDSRDPVQALLVSNAL